MDEMAGAVLVRDLVVNGSRWSKGRQLTVDDLEVLARPGTISPAIETLTVIIPGPDDLHEDAASLRLAAAVSGPGLTMRGPHESRVDLLAAAAGVVHVRPRELELLNRIDPLEVFTALD